VLDAHHTDKGGRATHEKGEDKVKIAELLNIAGATDPGDFVEAAMAADLRENFEPEAICIEQIDDAIEVLIGIEGQVSDSVEALREYRGVLSGAPYERSRASGVHRQYTEALRIVTDKFQAVDDRRCEEITTLREENAKLRTELECAEARIRSLGRRLHVKLLRELEDEDKPAATVRHTGYEDQDV